MDLLLPQFFISMLLFMVLFFGIGFLLNMLLRATWFMVILYPLVVVMIVDDVRFFEYFTKPGSSFQKLGSHLVNLSPSDITILAFGLIGAILAGVAIKMLRVRGYQMF
ncbi:YuiB family protein [Fictibacillus phosphorivorans]|uniref:YuiB family protein n=1 Tax=Fictibacillus phosphorivorans TaxID=1221500 RepID=UPI00203F1B53|nr:YuiB family protein [Fictibacillus phosphorivorans]MCM3718755.1 YuiB family protein [Fictibacillus phosphorivorans]MCM3776378.1 YuiB family protein [Fictibacillus phosphorivorans]